MSIIERSTLINLLSDTMAEVTFNKINGDERVMWCTLKDTPALKGGRVTVINEDVLNVWDVNAEGWRSFRMDNITKVQL